MILKKKAKAVDSSVAKLKSLNVALRYELAEAKDTLRAIQNGEVDALVVCGKDGEQIFTLKNADQPYRVFVENMNEGAATLSSDGIIYYCNKCFAETLKTPIEELIGSSIYIFISLEEAKKFKNILKSDTKHGSQNSFLFKDKCNKTVPLLISMSSSDINEKDSVSIIATNMTQQVQLKEYEKLAADLSEAVRARDEFISIASHELKTPLTSLLLQSQMQLKMIKSNDPKAFEESRIRNLSQQAALHVTKLNVLVDDMLDISRLKSGGLSIRKQSVDLYELTNKVIKNLSPQLVSAGCKKPYLSGDKTVGLWDPMRLEQVINNLLINAIKYGGPSQIAVHITSSKGWAQCSIIDKGKGIPKRDQLRIFERYERAISANEISGMGMGLYISQQLIQAHDGRIWVKSENGNGSTFYFEIPLGIA